MSEITSLLDKKRYYENKDKLHKGRLTISNLKGLALITLASISKTKNNTLAINKN